MLRLFVCSDIHKQLDHFTQALAQETSEGRVDAVLIAGDLQLSREDLVALQIGQPIYLVHGNNDAPLAPSNPADELVLDITGDRIASVQAVKYGASIPPRPEGAEHRILMTHGHEYHAPRLQNLRARAAEAQADIVVYGHTHRYQVDAAGPSEALVLNPGTLMPKPDSGRCTYMVLEIQSDEVRALRCELCPAPAYTA
ncbi:MAG: YfcE family phosphodiesterase [Atopobiaceae bacterium]